FMLLDVGRGVIFFFRAEDGIRDFHVTGVQTCALPISRRSIIKALNSIDLFGELSLVDQLSKLWPLTEMPGWEFEVNLAESIHQRSEERRVGKSVHLGGRCTIRSAE